MCASTEKKESSAQVSGNKTAGGRLLRAGIAGAGLMGDWHARASKKAGGEIVAVADSDKERAIRLAAKYQTAQSFGDAAEMIEQKSLDVLHICTPTGTHTKLAKIAAEAKINLFIEKPLAPTTAETVFIYDLAAANGTLVCPAHQFAFQRGVRQAEKLLPRIGRIVHLQAEICSAGGGKNSDAGEIDAIAADILPHPLSLFQKFTSDGLLSEENWTVFRPQTGEIRVFGQARKVSLSIFVSINSRPTMNSFGIFGTDGAIRLDLFHGFAFLETGKVSKRRKILYPFDSAVRRFSAASFNLALRAIQNETAYPGLRRLVNDFYRSIREKGEPPVTPAQAINIARIRDYLIHHGGIGKSEADFAKNL